MVLEQGWTRLRSLGEETMLNLFELSGTRALLVIVNDVVDPGADRITPHQASVVGLQQSETLLTFLIPGSSQRS